MPITVEVWTELAEPELDGRLTGFRIPAEVSGNERFPLLRWVDPWGDTVFNRAQCRALVLELDVLAAQTGDEVIREIRELAERVAAEPHLYLVFIGD